MNRGCLIVLAGLLLPALALGQIEWEVDLAAVGGVEPEWVEPGDIDGDGDLDLVTVSALADQPVMWWENDGDGGTWNGHQIVAVGNEPRQVELGDLDGDGDLDIVTILTSTYQILWWENVAGDGSTWDEHLVAVYDAVWDVELGDLDGDGDLDIVACAIVFDVVDWWENVDGSGLVWSQENILIEATHCRGVNVQDINGDGWADLTLALTGSDEILLLLSVDGSGSSWDWVFVTDSFNSVDATHGADFDGDGDLDILGCGYGFQVYWYENVDGNAQEWTSHFVDNPTNNMRSAVPADVDGDGDMDVVMSNTGVNEVGWSENLDGQGTNFDWHAVIQAPTNPGWVHVGDVTGNGLADLICDFQEEDVVRLMKQVPPPFITVVSPNGGEVWQMGTQHEIAWEDNIDDPVTIRLYREGLNVLTIAGNTPSDGSYLWTIPTNLVANNEYSVKITPLGQTEPFDWSDTNFEITAATAPVQVTLTPTGSTEIPSGGGTLTYEVHVVNNTGNSYQNVQYWTKILLPNGNWYNQILFQQSFTMPAGLNTTANLFQNIPAMAPAGGYEHWGWVGQNPNYGPSFGDGFEFTKTP